MRVIGTAGHVDHGKSTLIEALTGIHPDRLREEREREMTIVLGFAWAMLPNGEEIGIVDVPGHRDFIENMLSGIGAIDAALFVVAADEGVMPQTREHLDILNILQIQGGVVALTKTDLVDDPEWLDLVESDLKETLSGTVFDSTPIIRVSAKNGQGISELLETLEDSLSDKHPRIDYDRPRMSIDRAFTMAGFGTIVTGTLIDGYFQVGDEVLVLPSELPGRIRGLQTHKRKEQIAVPGSRTAVNISGIDVSQIQRGDVVVYPGKYRPSRRFDVQFTMLPNVSLPLRHNSSVKLFVGAAEVIARVRLLGTDLLKPGVEGWLQLELSDPVVGIRGDRYILRRPSPGETLGGGIILDSQPVGRHKRYDQQQLNRLESLVKGDPTDILLIAALTLGVATKKNIISRTSLNQKEAHDAFEDLLEDGQILVLDAKKGNIQQNSLITSASYWMQLTEKAKSEIAVYHELFPLRTGMPREELKSRLKVSPRVFNACAECWLANKTFEAKSVRKGIPGVSPTPIIHAPGFKVSFSDHQQIQVEHLLGRFEASPYSPPTIKESLAEVGGDDVLNAMIDTGYLIPLTTDVIFRQEDYYRFVDEIRAILEEQGTISVAQVRDTFQTSRRYVLAILEHLDLIGVTVRVGDIRKLKSNS